MRYHINSPDDKIIDLEMIRLPYIDQYVFYDEENYPHMLFQFKLQPNDDRNRYKPYLICEICGNEIWLEPYKEKD